jgi:hypothetical protein
MDVAGLQAMVKSALANAGKKPVEPPIVLSKQMQAVVDRQKELSAEISPVQKLATARKDAKTKAIEGNYFNSETYLRLKANEIKYRIDLYKNLGLAPEYEAAQQEGAEVVAKYQALLKAGKIGKSTDTTA